MSSTTVSMTTYYCDLPGCKNEITAGGDHPWTHAESEGWSLDTAITDSHIDLCPEHREELRKWLIGEL